ncbi:hypothetical protein [Lutispora thermophila]|uniref:Uncharacterized protein n=1 Tax=Lutispora thermophila DSM 19022 TaxID=1122184 RepID=A0A1M6H2B0_9FIRM|nr:hypothetical protein [Lutispora thermophila]SHJ16295.1 hypothetical protein SAMN02745176_02615 [Lutispora thermophila DSM 19022]
MPKLITVNMNENMVDISIYHVFMFSDIMGLNVYMSMNVKSIKWQNA